jgi:hypothetical protein
MYVQELEDKVTNVIIFSQNDFVSAIKKRIKSYFESKFKIAIEKVKEVASIVAKKDKEIVEKYNSINKLVSFSLEQNKLKKTEVFVTEFQKHCNMTGDYAIHQCEGKMLPIFEKDEVKFVICENCKKLYTPNSMLLYCYFCSNNYFSTMLSYKRTENLLPATWENHHCGTMVNDKMRCIKCKDIFFLNIDENMLYCKSCKFSIDPMGIIWQCTYCNQDYKTPAKVYNHIEYKIIKNFIKETLKIKQKAKPLTVPCCNVGVYDYIFFHKKSCDGELFQGELNKITMILCEKCKMIYQYDKFTWTCPNCFKRFRKTIKPRNVKVKDSSPKSIDKKQKFFHERKYTEAEKIPKVEEKLVNFKRQSSNNDLPISSVPNITEDDHSLDNKQIKINNLMSNYCTNNNNKNDQKIAKNNINIKVINLKSCFSAQSETKETKEFHIVVKDFSTIENNDSYINSEEAKIQEIKIKENVEHLQKLVTFTLDDYKVLQTIGEGSYGVIYLVQENKATTKFAMKKIIINNEAQLITFTNEYEIVHQIKHNNVLKIKGLSHKKLDETTNVLYILMELAKTDWDKEIKHRASNQNYYTEEELICVIRMLVEALHYLEEKNIAHRDIKPQNVLIFENRLFKLADFGEAKEVKLLAQKHKGTLRGTELYMAPALFNSLDFEKAVEHNPYKSDVFSLGFCVLFAATLSFNILYELRKLTNKKLIHAVIQKHLSDRYSSKFITLMCRMVEYNEKYRFDFIQLKAFMEKNI